MIDWARIKQLEHDFGVECFGEIVDVFLDEVDEVLAPLRQGYDGSRLEKDMHFLKGSALNLGFRQFGQLCADNEGLAAEGRGDEVSIPEILAAYDSSKAEFLVGFATAKAS
jgi:histidine phosphotransfer protein HptB